MRSIEELRRAMRDETADLAPRVTFAQVRQRARRRRFTGLFTFAATVLVSVAATMTALAGAPAGPAPLPAPSLSAVAPTLSAAAAAPTQLAGDTELRGTGPVVRTGVAYGTGEELVLRYSGDDMNGLYSALHDPAKGTYRRLGGGITVPPVGGFSTILELDDRHGGIVDYGVVHGAGLRVELTADGQRTQASTAELPGMPDATIFWVRRAGVAVQPTGAVGGPTPDLGFTARDAAGVVVATGGQVQRSDGEVVIADTSVQIGDLMRTGVTLADGGRLVLWFSGDERGAGLVAGSDHGTGAPTEVRGLGRFARPPFDIGFYGGRHEFDEAGGTKVVVAVYVGPAATVTLGAPGATGRGSARWSAHPQLRVAWVNGVPAGDGWKVNGVATDAQGAVVAAYDGR
ncbi:hypothetical protein GCM10009827_047870 [Dactylosporangium maewongense]|uniref:Uncharacterized protein n=2 Tax=Dactylosporangium maewongense TaxID=634393 RepID=A0ABN2ASH8_9ACTN